MTKGPVFQTDNTCNEIICYKEIIFQEARDENGMNWALPWVKDALRAYG